MHWTLWTVVYSTVGSSEFKWPDTEDPHLHTEAEEVVVVEGKKNIYIREESYGWQTLRTRDTTIGAWEKFYLFYKTADF